LGDHPRAERAGPVAADSLAAESTRQGGGFSENRGAEPLGVKGSSSTFANTDTSGATTLAPARDASERDANTTEKEIPDDLKGPGGRKYPEAVGGQADFPGIHDAEKHSGGSTQAKQELASHSDEPVYQKKAAESTASGNHGSGESKQASGSNDPGRQTTDTESAPPREPAPGYAAYVASSSALGGKPKGKNITEGGFDDDSTKNASFDGDIKDEDDPGREAAKHFQGEMQSASGDVGPTQKTISGDGQFDVLDAEKRL
jgi:hypothetical protein